MPLGDMVMAYSDKLLDHYENPRNVGKMDPTDPSVGTGLVGAPACGDVMKLQIKVDDGGLIEDACFKTFGCGSAIASSSLVTEWIKGKTLDEANEIKNTDIAENSKVNHLSYIGDSDIGKNLNIGAGTITCNYDGVNKHRTIVEDEVFIGSNSQLVAPVKIGRGSTVGAGSTITKDIPEHQLSISRSKQINIKGWKKPSKKK